MFINTYNENENMIIYETLPSEEIDIFSFEMLRANPLVEVIQCGIKRDDDSKTTQILIPISNLVPLEKYLTTIEGTTSGVIDRYRKEYFNIIEKVENLMVPKEELILNFFYSFVDPDEGSLILPVIPADYSFLESHTFFEFESCIKNTLDISSALPKEDSKIKKREKKDKLKEKKERNTKAERDAKRERDTKAERGTKRERDTKAEEIIENENIVNQRKIKPKRENRFFEKIMTSLESNSKDDIFDFESDTMLPEGIHVIVVRSTGEEYPLVFGPDVIGTDPERCSIAFPNNKNMEAEHCSITLARSKYFIADLNTRTGTLLNGVPVEPGKTYELRSADLITVAGEELVFSKRN